jgi:hypothetical protein
LPGSQGESRKENRIELKEFIKDTLVHVAMGIREANVKLNESYKPKLEHLYFIIPEAPHGMETTIRFDVAVTVSEADAKSGGGGIKVYALEAGGEKRHEATSERVFRIGFAVTTNALIGVIKHLEWRPGFLHRRPSSSARASALYKMPCVGVSNCALVYTILLTGLRIPA